MAAQHNSDTKAARLPLHAHPQGTAAQQALVSRAQQYMIRRTSETLKQYLPAKVQEVSADVPGWAADALGAERRHTVPARCACCRASSHAAAGNPQARQLAWDQFELCLSTPSQVIFCKMSALQHSIYKGFLASEAVKGVPGGCAGMLRNQTVLQHTCRRTTSFQSAGHSWLRW